MDREGGSDFWHKEKIVMQSGKHLYNKWNGEADPHQRIAEQPRKNALIGTAQHFYGQLCERKNQPLLLDPRSAKYDHGSHHQKVDGQHNAPPSEHRHGPFGPGEIDPTGKPS